MDTKLSKAQLFIVNQSAAGFLCKIVCNMMSNLRKIVLADFPVPLTKNVLPSWQPKQLPLYQINLKEK